MIKDNGLPIYEIVMDGCEGLYAIALVKDPATMVSWLAFSKDQPQQLKCSVLNEEERRVLAVIARADFPFYRYIDGFEFYAVFSKETIKQMAQKFLKDGYQNAINVEHNPDGYIDGVEITQMFIKDSAKGISPKGFECVEDGSLFAEYKIENDEVWANIKAGVYTSISLEGFFNVKPTGETYSEPTIIDNDEDFWKYLEDYK